MTTFRSSGKLVYSFKSPLTISGTSSRWRAVRVVGDSGQVKMDDNPFAGGSSDHQTDPAEVAALESAVACGNAETAFVQYNGGFTWQRPTCATIHAFDEGGHRSGSITIPFGRTYGESAAPCPIFWRATSITSCRSRDVGQ